jgi:hypothetical protein
LHLLIDDGEGTLGFAPVNDDGACLPATLRLVEGVRRDEDRIVLKLIDMEAFSGIANLLGLDAIQLDRFLPEQVAARSSDHDV